MADASRAELTFKRFVAQAAVAEELLMELDVRAQTEAVFGQVLFQLRARVLSDDLPPEHLTARQRVTYEVSASTWQMWKKRHARRLVARWPVRYQPDQDGRGTDAVCSFDLERYRLYPRARVVLPPGQFGTVVHAHSLRGPWWHHEAGARG